MSNRVGQQWGNYRLLRLLGRDGFAGTYLGEHIYLGTLAVIKVLDARISTETDLERFSAEARTIARLKHPQIVPVLDFGVSEGMLFLIMEYAPHGSLRDRHPQGTRLPLFTVVSYVEQIAEALQYAHKLHVMHGDLKPDNVLIGPRDELLLSDFGIAAITQASHSHSSSTVIGTVNYMAPEQLQGQPRLASDQYALGIMAYEWLCGISPFRGSTFMEIAVQHLTVAAPPLHENVPSISPTVEGSLDWGGQNVEKVVLQALAKDPYQRFESVQAFANALKQASAGQVAASTVQYQATSLVQSTEVQKGQVTLNIPGVLRRPEQTNQTTIDRSHSEGQKEQVAPHVAGPPPISLRIRSFFHSAIGKVLSIFGFNKKALKYYEHAIFLEAHHPRLYISKGEILFNLKRYKEALTDYDEAIRLAPGSSKAYRGRGKTYEQLAQQSYDELSQRAQESYEKAKELGTE